MNSDGKVILVGGGPGDPQLLTLAGAAALSEADVVVYDNLVPMETLGHVKAGAQTIFVGKKPKGEAWKQDHINKLLIEQAAVGKVVVRLKGGDPFVFGRGGEECEALVEAGIYFEVIPGVTAAVAASACAGIPVTHRAVTATVALVSGHEDPTKPSSSVDYRALAGIGTVVFYMGVKNLPHIVAQLLENGKSAETPVAVIRWGTCAEQRTVTGTLADITERVHAARITPPAITVVGDVVALREKLNWFERRPLFGQTVVVTRTRQQSSVLSAKLRRLGAHVIEAPTIQVVAPSNWDLVDETLLGIAQYDWLVFTSANGVDALYERLCAIGKDTRHIASIKVAAIGEGTAQRLRSIGINADCIPPRFVAEALAEELIQHHAVAGKHIILFRADIARPVLIDLLEAAGAMCTSVEVYRTVLGDGLLPQAVEALNDGTADWVTFTSSSTARNFVELFGKAPPCRSASIGPITSAALRELGIEPAVEASEYHIDGLVAAIVEEASQ